MRIKTCDHLYLNFKTPFDTPSFYQKIKFNYEKKHQ
jgi:hypothetical protein